MEQIRLCLSLLDRNGRRQILGLAALVFVGSVLEMLTVSMILPFLAIMNNVNLIKTSKPLHWIYSTGHFTTGQRFLMAVGGFLLLLVLVKNAYLFFVMKRQSHFVQRQASRVSVAILCNYLRAPYQTHLKRNSAALINTVDHAVEQAFAQVMMPFLILVTEASAIIAILILLLFVEPLVTASLAVLVTIPAATLIILMRRRLLDLGSRVLSLRRWRLQSLQQSLHSIKEVKVFGRESFFLSAFSNARMKHAAAFAEAETLTQAPRQVLEVIIVGGLIAVMLFIIAQGRTNAEVMTVLGLFAMAAFRIMPGANRLVTAYNLIKHGNAYLKDTAKDYFSSANSVSPGKDSIPTFRRKIVMRNVTFSYEDASAAALNGVNLTIKRGEAIGIVGKSGSGKSTLVEVLLGLLPPDNGEIEIDEVDVTCAGSTWHNLVGYVPQSVSLIDDTLKNNVAFGISPENIDDEKIWRALDRASLRDFAAGLINGINTELGERGVRMSGGQRQRVGIARALYNDPQLLIFDEATAALDNESEQEITKAIESLHGEKTLIIIAHRLSTIKMCDRLILMNSGRISATGTFEDLRRSSDEFSEYVRLADLHLDNS